MSVHEGDRGEGKMTVLTKANRLATYTIQICSNQKIFIPQYHDAIVEDIVNTAKNIFIDCFTANEILVREGTFDYEKHKTERRRLQQRAKHNCNRLLALIQMAQPIFHLRLKRIEYWGCMILGVRSLIYKWEESDVKRFS